MTNLETITTKLNRAIRAEQSRLNNLSDKKRYEVYCNANSLINRLKLTLKRVYKTSLYVTDLEHSVNLLTIETAHDSLVNTKKDELLAMGREIEDQVEREIKKL